ncbi:GPI mannosyltransferase 3 [Aspergillus udagawae]|nr:GPI mannosyltransferase 3 [Aspergillus udagawae]GFG26893.1 GPI mannosyltransferase 3 [Aspergillus udagawae]
MSSSRRRKSFASSSSSSPSFHSPSPPTSRLRPRSPPSSNTKTSPSSTTPLSTNILLFLIAFRLVNAFTVRTFFQPDEFFQSLEPAWQIAFGENQGAWITWEWRHQLRSSIHPLLFAAVYSAADVVAQLLRLSPASRADLLVAAPKTAQAVIAALGDFYTWKLARYVYGARSYEAWATLALTVISPWQWFCSTRTLSNCLETTITIVALHLWPWSWSFVTSPRKKATRAASRERAQRDQGVSDSLQRLRQCLTLAAVACILRPTNILIWMGLASVAWYRTSWDRRRILVREVLLCGCTVLGLSSVVDRLFYGSWTFPPLRFLYFNIAQSLAVFYGRNDWHYYISQGFPLLLTTALPFALVGLYHALAQVRTSGLGQLQSLVQAQLALICVVMPFILSLVSHKEVRFIYPLLPSLHILSAPPLVDYFLPAVLRSSRSYMPRRLTLVFLLLVNIAIALYTTIYHASGPSSVLSYLRQQHELHAPAAQTPNLSPSVKDDSQRGITAGFLMPCHSTPWRSHLVYPTIHAWALTCEPPVDQTAAEKATYVDEADQFYANPAQFLRDHMAGGLRHIPRKPSYLSAQAHPQSPSTNTNHSIHEWPDYLIFFAQLEPTLQSLLRASSYAECYRSFNTAWHDDWRRKGDIVVWCLDPAEQQAWRSATRQRDLENRDRQFDRIIESFRKEATGKRSDKLSPFRRWISSSPSVAPSSSLSLSWPSSWRWPWSQRKRTSWLGVQIPQWTRTQSSWTAWGGDWFRNWTQKKKTKKLLERDLWL